MKLINLAEEPKFISEKADKPYREVLYDSPNLRVVAFNFEAEQELPVHCESADSEVALLILEGEGRFLGAHPGPAKTENLMILPVCEPHGLKAHSRLRLLCFITPAFAE